MTDVEKEIQKLDEKVKQLREITREANEATKDLNTVLKAAERFMKEVIPDQMMEIVEPLLKAHREGITGQIAEAITVTDKVLLDRQQKMIRRLSEIPRHFISEAVTQVLEAIEEDDRRNHAIKEVTKGLQEVQRKRRR